MEYKKKADIRALTIENGMEYPSDEELLMMILGSGTKDCPVALLADKVSDVIFWSSREKLLNNLKDIKGMGEKKALQVVAALELGRRKNSSRGVRIGHPCDLVPYVKEYALRDKEYFLCVTLNGCREIMQIHVISVGTVNTSVVFPREVFAPALKESAAAVIVCHNHPSGKNEPSKADIETTERLLQASEAIGIPILDHIIIDRFGFYSFMEHGLLFT